MNENRMNEISGMIINCCFTVSNKLGVGFLEKVYENSLLIELRKSGLMAESQKPLHVFYDGFVVGEYFADILVEDEIVIELKAVRNLDEVHKAQLMNYLKASGKKLGLLINFGNAKIDVKRIANGLGYENKNIV